MWQYNVIVRFLRNWNDLFCCTKHHSLLEETVLKRWRTICTLLQLLLCTLLLLLLRWDVPVPAGDASLYFAGESTGNRHCLWTYSPEQHNTWVLSSESWCGHGIKVEHATEPWSFHHRPSSAAQRVLSLPPSFSLVGLNRVFSRCYSSPCASVETCVSPFG